MSDHFDPYHVWLGIPPEESAKGRPNHYRLLGLRLLESDREVISNALDQRLVFLRTFQAGKRAALSQRLLNEVSAAGVVLLNAEKKAKYDAVLQANTSPPPVVALPVARGLAEPPLVVAPPAASTPWTSVPGKQAAPARAADATEAAVQFGLIPAPSEAAAARAASASISNRYNKSALAAAEPASLPIAPIVAGAIALAGILALALGGWWLIRSPALTKANSPPLASNNKPRISDLRRNVDSLQPPRVSSSGQPINSPPPATYTQQQAAVGPSASSQPSTTVQSPPTVQAGPPLVVSAAPNVPVGTPQFGTPPFVPPPFVPPPFASPPARVPLGGPPQIGNPPVVNPPVVNTPSENIKRRAVPNPQELAQREAEAREIFQEQLKEATRPSQKAALARTIRNSADDTSSDPVARYVLLDLARKVYIQAGEVAQSLATTRALERDFEIPADEMRLATIESLDGTTLPPDERTVLARTTIDLADELIDAEDFDQADRMSAIAAQSAGKQKDAELRKAIQQRRGQIVRLVAAAKVAEPSQDKLEDMPDDPAANLIVGKFRCLVLEDWETGLPHLAKAGDPVFAGPARLDLSAESGRAEDQAAAGDAWLKLATDPKATALISKDDRLAIRRRAKEQLSASLAGLVNLARVRVEKQLEELKDVDARAPQRASSARSSSSSRSRRRP